MLARKGCQTQKFEGPADLESLSTVQHILSARRYFGNHFSNRTAAHLDV